MQISCIENKRYQYSWIKEKTCETFGSQGMKKFVVTKFMRVFPRSVPGTLLYCKFLCFPGHGQVRIFREIFTWLFVAFTVVILLMLYDPFHKYTHLRALELSPVGY